MLFLEPYASEISAVEIIVDQATINSGDVFDTISHPTAGQEDSRCVLSIPVDRNIVQSVSKIAVVQFFKEVCWMNAITLTL